MFGISNFIGPEITSLGDVCFIVSQKPSMLTPRITPPAAAQKKTTQSTQTIYPNVVRIENGTVYRMTGRSIIASSIAGTAGVLYPAAAVLIGASGSFVTGTGLGSNIMFAPMHVDAAEMLGLNPVVVFAGQNAGGSLGNIQFFLFSFFFLRFLIVILLFVCESLPQCFTPQSMETKYVHKPYQGTYTSAAGLQTQQCCAEELLLPAR